MPALPLEPYVLPDDLFTNPSFQETGSQQWWVLHTRPRAEKCLGRHFQKRGIPFFLPLARRHRCSRDRLTISFLPLFPGYVFLLGDHQSRLEALATNFVARCLPVSDARQLYLDLGRIHQLMAAGAPLAPEERMQPGTWVEFTSGALEGLQGRIIRRGKRLRFFVEVQFLQRGASVEIDGWMIRPLGLSSPSARVGA